MKKLSVKDILEFKIGIPLGVYVTLALMRLDLLKAESVEWERDEEKNLKSITVYFPATTPVEERHKDVNS